MNGGRKDETCAMFAFLLCNAKVYPKDLLNTYCNVRFISKCLGQVGAETKTQALW